jgi:hypothetical protein
VAGSYASFGASVALFGVAVSLVSYFALFSVPFTALGVACVIIGLSALSLPEQPVPKRAVRSLLQGAALSIESLLEEFDVRERAVYLPPMEGLVTAYVPLSHDGRRPTAEEVRAAPRRVVTEAGGVPILTLFPPGAEVARAAELGEGQTVEDALSYLLVDVTELCSSVRAAEGDGGFIVEMKGVKEKTEAARYASSLGTIPTSLAACALAMLTGRPVTLEREESDGRRALAQVRLL